MDNHRLPAVSKCMVQQQQCAFSVRALLQPLPNICAADSLLQRWLSVTECGGNDRRGMAPSQQHNRKRCSFNATQVAVLETQFARSRYLTAEQRSRLARQLGMTEQQIKIWFQNRRYKTKRRHNSSSSTAASEAPAAKHNNAVTWKGTAEVWPRREPLSSSLVKPGDQPPAITAAAKTTPVFVLIQNGRLTHKYKQYLADKASASAAADTA